MGRNILDFYDSNEEKILLFIINEEKVLRKINTFFLSLSTNSQKKFSMKEFFDEIDFIIKQDVVLTNKKNLFKKKFIVYCDCEEWKTNSELVDSLIKTGKGHQYLKNSDYIIKISYNEIFIEKEGV